MTPSEWGGAVAATWNAVSALLNVLFWFKTPEEWIGFCERHPRLAALIRVVRTWGIDPVKGLLALRDVVRKKPAACVSPPPAAEAVFVVPEDRSPEAASTNPKETP